MSPDYFAVFSKNWFLTDHHNIIFPILFLSVLTFIIIASLYIPVFHSLVFF